MSAINTSIGERGWAVVTIHPQDFSNYQPDGQTAVNSVNQTSIARLNAVLDTINSSGYSIISFQQLIGAPAADTTPPDTAITSVTDGLGLPVINNGVTASGAISISFTGSDNVGVAGFQANRDSAGWSAATSPLQMTGFGLGAHTVQIRSIDTSGLADPTPASFSWTVILPDTTPPTVTSSPPGGTYSSVQSVTLTANEPAPTIYYTTDGSTPTTSSPIYSAPINISTTTTLKFFGRDASGNSSPVNTQTYTITPTAFPVTHMSDTTQTYGLSLYSTQQLHVEMVTASSQLVGKSIDQITLKIRKTGSPTGTMQIGVFNTDLTAKKLFGTKDATTVTSTYTDYTFSLTGGELYTIQSGDRIGIRFTVGNANNYAAVMLDRDASDPFDGSGTYRQQYNTSWGSYPADDMYMILRQTHA
jgi:hypothetical protein